MSIFRTRGRIRREAADWVARLGAGADGQNHEAFRRWYEVDSRHAEAYDRIAAIWSGAGKISPSASPEMTDHQPAQQPRRQIHLALAASLVIGLALATILIFGGQWLPDSGTSAEQRLSLASAVGEIKQIDLPDGSRVVLDSNSRIEARFTASERLLTLREGRARFVVAHESRPFIVSAASNEVIATGTVFDVSLIQNRLAVLLIEGSVEVRQSPGSRRGAVHRLEAGQKLVIEDQASPVRQAATRGDTAWPTHMLEFNDTPLEEAVAMVNRYSRVQLRLGNDRIRNLRVSGAYRAGDVTGFARSLAAAFDLRLVTLADGNILLADLRASSR